jgi:hypothetical protein
MAMGNLGSPAGQALHSVNTTILPKLKYSHQAYSREDLKSPYPWMKNYYLRVKIQPPTPQHILQNW